MWFWNDCINHVTKVKSEKIELKKVREKQFINIDEERCSRTFNNLLYNLHTCTVILIFDFNTFYIPIKGENENSRT